jgi:diguanylate cyclase
VIRAIVGLAKGFGLQTIAEGVEDEETLEMLRDFGVDHVQGFHVGRPALLIAGAPSPSSAC